MAEPDRQQIIQLLTYSMRLKEALRLMQEQSVFRLLGEGSPINITPLFTKETDEEHNRTIEHLKKYLSALGSTIQEYILKEEKNNAKL